MIMAKTKTLGSVNKTFATSEEDNTETCDTTSWFTSTV